MNEWSAGYVTEIDYIPGYFPELSPGVMRLAALNRGVITSRPRPLRYLELGFGQGVSLNLHAAACGGEFWGVDFNPAHAANARELAEAAGTGARVFDLSFAELAERTDLPEFDFITLHGIWSWISDENRKVIVRIAREHLAVGGLFYVSYNCGPGWSSGAPLRHLVALHADLAGQKTKPITDRVGEAFDFVQSVSDAGGLYFQHNPRVAKRLENTVARDRRYLVHEYLGRDWHLTNFAEVAETLSEAKLDFAASGYLIDHVDDVNLRAEGKALMASITHPILQETVRDYLTDQQFRKDIYVKGLRRLWPAAQIAQFEALRFTLALTAEISPPDLTGPLGKVTLPEASYRALIAALAKDNFAPKAVRELLPIWQGQSLGALAGVLLLLTSCGQVYPVQDDSDIEAATPVCRRLNAYLCERALTREDVAHMASPVIGAGVVVSRSEQLFLRARAEGRTDPAEWARFAWAAIERGGQRMLKDGKAVESPEENLAMLLQQANTFVEHRLPLLQALRVAD
jgi:hypothetical protein